MSHQCDTSGWQAAPGEHHVCPEPHCGRVWVAKEWGPLDIKWVPEEPPWDRMPNPPAGLTVSEVREREGLPPVSTRADDIKQSIFGVSDGLTSALGVVIPSAILHRPMFEVIFGLAICAAIGMGGGEFLSDRSGSIRSALMMAVASFVGTLIPAAPFLLLPDRPWTTALSIGLSLATVAAISETKARDRTGPGRHVSRLRAYAATFGILLFAAVITTGFALTTGAAG